MPYRSREQHRDSAGLGAGLPSLPDAWGYVLPAPLWPSEVPCRSAPGEGAQGPLWSRQPHPGQEEPAVPWGQDPAQVRPRVGTADTRRPSLACPRLRLLFMGCSPSWGGPQGPGTEVGSGAGDEGPSHCPHFDPILLHRPRCCLPPLCHQDVTGPGSPPSWGWSPTELEDHQSDCSLSKAGQLGCGPPPTTSTPGHQPALLGRATPHCLLGPLLGVPEAPLQPQW